MSSVEDLKVGRMEGWKFGPWCAEMELDELPGGNGGRQ
jgi:hypothetical protein